MKMTHVSNGSGILLPVQTVEHPPHPWPLTEDEDGIGYSAFHAVRHGKAGIMLPLPVQWQGLSADERRKWVERGKDQPS